MNLSKCWNHTNHTEATLAVLWGLSTKIATGTSSEKVQRAANTWSYSWIIGRFYTWLTGKDVLIWKPRPPNPDGRWLWWMQAYGMMIRRHSSSLHSLGGSSSVDIHFQLVVYRNFYHALIVQCSTLFFQLRLVNPLASGLASRVANKVV